MIFLINSTLIPVDVVLTDLVRSKWPNIEEIFCVQSLNSRTIFNYHSPQRTHWVSNEFLLRDKRGKSRRARRAYCAHLVSQSKHDSLELAHVRTQSRLSNIGTYRHWCLWGGVLRDDAEVGPILFGSDQTLFTPTLTVKHASGDPSIFCWTPPAQTPYLSWAQLNRPLAELGHVFYTTWQHLAGWQVIQAFIPITKLLVRSSEAF